MATEEFARLDDSGHKEYGASGLGMVNIARLVVKTFAENIQRDVITDMEGPKSGRVYGDHVASAPGESPAVWSGVLRDSIKIQYRLGGLLADIGVLTGYPIYGAMHETGVRGAIRPFMAPAMKKNELPFMESMRMAILRK